MLMKWVFCIVVTCCVGSVAIIFGSVSLTHHDAYCLIIKLNYCHTQHQVLATGVRNLRTGRAHKHI